MPKEVVKYSVAWAARQPALSCCEKTVYRLIEAGQLGCIRRPGASVRILPRHIEEYEARFERPAKVPEGNYQGQATMYESRVGLASSQKFKSRAKARKRQEMARSAE